LNAGAVDGAAGLADLAALIEGRANEGKLVEREGRDQGGFGGDKLEVGGEQQVGIVEEALEAVFGVADVLDAFLVLDLAGAPACAGVGELDAGGVVQAALPDTLVGDVVLGDGFGQDGGSATGLDEGPVGLLDVQEGVAHFLNEAFAGDVVLGLGDENVATVVVEAEAAQQRLREGGDEAGGVAGVEQLVFGRHVVLGTLLADVGGDLHAGGQQLAKAALDGAGVADGGHEGRGRGLVQLGPGAVEEELGIEGGLGLDELGLADGRIVGLEADRVVVGDGALDAFGQAQAHLFGSGDHLEVFEGPFFDFLVVAYDAGVGLRGAAELA
jgi:hypothetical protein